MTDSKIRPTLQDKGSRKSHLGASALHLRWKSNFSRQFVDVVRDDGRQSHPSGHRLPFPSRGCPYPTKGPPRGPKILKDAKISIRRFSETTHHEKSPLTGRGLSFSGAGFIRIFPGSFSRFCSSILAETGGSHCSRAARGSSCPSRSLHTPPGSSRTRRIPHPDRTPAR